MQEITITRAMKERTIEREIEMKKKKEFGGRDGIEERRAMTEKT